MFAENKLQLNDSWLFSAYQKHLPIWTAGFEDSTIGNMIVAKKELAMLPGYSFVMNGLEQMSSLTNWYMSERKKKEIGFFQIGGGISGDFALCVVPLIVNDLGIDIKAWSLFTQISDSTTSYGSFSGALPKEKITWNKINQDTPMHSINSDATIVFPIWALAVLDALNL